MEMGDFAERIPKRSHKREEAEEAGKRESLIKSFPLVGMLPQS